MDLEIIKSLFSELQTFLELQDDNSIRDIQKAVRNTVSVLESDESNTFKADYAVEVYKNLFTGRAGLTEYYIWDDDYEKRVKLNEPLDKIRSELWKIMKHYV